MFRTTVGVALVALFGVASAVADDTAAVRTAVEALKDGGKLTLEKREYRLTSVGAKKTFLAPSNNTTGEKNVVFPLFDKNDVTIDGNGATLVCDGDVFPFATLRSRNVTIRNLTITKPHPVVAALTVTAADEKGFTVTFAPGSHPYAVKDGELVFEVDGHRMSTRDGLVAFHAMDKFHVHYILTEKSAANENDKDAYPSTYSAVAIEDLGNGEVYFRYRDADKDRKLCTKVPYAPGRPLGINLYARRNLAFFFEDARDVRLENVTIRRFGGMGLVAQRSGYLTIDGLKVLPQKGDVASTTADMMQINSCYGKVTIENCEGADSMDDVIDIHGNYMGLASWDGTNAVLRNYRDWGKPTNDDHYGFFPVRAGDLLSFLDESNRREIGRMTVAALTADPKDLSHVTVKLEGRSKMPLKLPKEVLVENLTLYPDVTFRNNRFTHYPNLRFSGRGSYLIEGNRLENAMTAFLIHDLKHYWYETGPVEDMTIRNNTFVDCNAQGGDAFIRICPMGWHGGGKMGRILLEGNRYEKLKDKRVAAYAVTDLVDRDTPPAPVATYYVATNGDDFAEGTLKSPLRTLRQAVRLARERRADGYRRIVVRDGTYRVDDKPIHFDRENGRIILEAEHPGKVLLTGAEPVTGWTVDPEDERFLVAPLPFAPQPKMLYMLSVNGENAELASFPEYGGEEKMPYLASPEDAWTGNRTKMKYDSQYLPKGRDFRDLDLDSVWLTIPQEWATTRSYIATNDWKNDTFYLQTPANMALGTFNKGIQLVNLRLGLRKPGMWMFEAKRGHIVYWPKEGETAANLKASVSRAVSVFTLHLAHDVTIRGLTIEGLAAPFGDRTAPKGTPAPWAIHATAGHCDGKSLNFRVENCEIRNCAGGGINVWAGNDCRFERNHVHHLGGVGICCQAASRHNSVSWNHVHHCGMYNTSAAQIAVQSAWSDYVGNHTHDGPREGIIMWSGHSVFASNHIHHVMKSSRDGGGLYGGYSYTLVKDNWVHDTGNWPGLYNDEGGMHCVFTGNRFDGLWWPFHMHDTYGIVVTNNTITYDGGMRFSFMGSIHCVFSNNLIRTAMPITSDPYVENCDVWSNRIALRQADGSYGEPKTLSFPKVAQKPKDPVRAYRAAGPGIVGNAVSRPNMRWRWRRLQHLDRSTEGFSTRGVPGANLSAAFDATNLYLTGTYEYNKFVGYPGARSLGHVWGKSDGVKFVFKGLEMQVFFDGTCISSDPTFVATTNNFIGRFVGGVGCGTSEFAVAIPLKMLGLAGDAEGREIAFNAVMYNGDHREYLYWEKPDGKDELTSTLKFVPFDPDHTGYVQTTLLADGEGTIVPGPMVPGGRIQVDLETSYRPRDDYGDVQGYRPRNAYLMGYTFRDRSESRCLGGRAFLVQPFTGDDPKPGTRRAQRMEQSSESAKAGFYQINLQDWDLWTKATATDRVAYHDFEYWRGGLFKVLVDTNFADGEVTECEASVGADGVLAARIRVKDGWFSSHEVWGRFAFDRKPVAVRELPAEEGVVGKRFIFEFLLPPSDGHVILKTAVSETGAADAAANFASADGFDFAKRTEDARLAWEKLLGPTGIDGDFKARRTLMTAAYGAYVVPARDRTSYRVRLEDGFAEVSAEGWSGPGARLSHASVNGVVIQACDKLAEKVFASGDRLSLEYVGD